MHYAIMGHGAVGCKTQMHVQTMRAAAHIVSEQ
jgi:hypothetical protein